MLIHYGTCGGGGWMDGLTAPTTLAWRLYLPNASI